MWLESFLLAERALLRRTIGQHAGFHEDCKKLETIAGRRWKDCDGKASTVDAFVLKAWPESYEPGILSTVAFFLICPELAGKPKESGYLERIADQLLENQDQGCSDYESLYLCSLLQRNDECPWREVPKSLTGERAVFVVDMHLDRLFLPNDMLTGSYVTCSLAKTWEGDYTAYLRLEQVA